MGATDIVVGGHYASDVTLRRLRVDEIRVIGRATQGVKLMNLDKGDVVVDVARVVIEDEVVDEDLDVGAEGEVPADEAAEVEAPEAADETEDGEEE